MQDKDLFEARIGLQIELRQRYDKRQESAAGFDMVNPHLGESWNRMQLEKLSHIKTKCIGWTMDGIIYFNNNYFIQYCHISNMDQGEPGLDYNDANLNPLVCDICSKSFDSLDKLGEHQKQEHDM